MDAYYAPDFSSNFISSHILSDDLEVHVTAALCSKKACLLFKKGALFLDDIFRKTK